MSRTFSGILVGGVLLLCATGRVGAEDDAQWTFGEPPSRLANSMVCGSLTDEDLTADDRFLAIDPRAGLALMQELAGTYPDLALAVMQWLPVEGWVPSFGAKGEFEGYLAFEPGAVELGPIFDRLAAAMDPATGLSAGAIDALHAELSRSVEQQDAALAEDEALLIRGDVVVSESGVKELLLASERQRFTGPMSEGVPVRSDSDVEIAVVLSTDSARDLPVLSFSDVRARAPVHTVDAVRVVRGER